MSQGPPGSGGPRRSGQPSRVSAPMGRAWGDRLRGLTSGVRAEPGIVALAAALGAAYAVYAVLRHVHFQTGLDLTIFDQAVWHLSRFEEPASTMKGVPNLWGDHF